MYLGHIRETKTSKTASVLGQDNAIYTFSIELSLSSKGQSKSEIQKVMM